MKARNLIHLFVAACVFLCASVASAQTFNLVSILGGTANSPASTDNTTFYTTNSTVMASKAVEMAIQVDFKLQGAGTSAVIFRFDESNDGISWTGSTRLMTNTAAGATLVSKVQTFTVGAVGFLRLASINNANATAVTNLVIKYGQKRL